MSSNYIILLIFYFIIIIHNHHYYCLVTTPKIIMIILFSLINQISQLKEDAVTSGMSEGAGLIISSPSSFIPTTDITTDSVLPVGTLTGQRSYLIMSQMNNLFWLPASIQLLVFVFSGFLHQIPFWRTRRKGQTAEHQNGGHHQTVWPFSVSNVRECWVFVGKQADVLNPSCCGAQVLLCRPHGVSGRVPDVSLDITD